VIQTTVIIRLALHELWISFRLLVLLAAYVGVGATVALLPGPLSTILVRLASGAAAAMVVGAAIAAWALSRERTLGRAGWLATRSVSRATILVGWFLSLALVSMLGLLAAGVLGWLTASASVARLDAFAFAMTFGAIACCALALLALGLLVGARLRPSAAPLVAVAASVAIAGVAWLAAPRIPNPIAALAQLPELASPISTAVQGAGASLAAAAALLLVARFALDRVDL